MKTKSKISAYILRGSTAALLFSCGIVALCSAINLPEQPLKAAPSQDNAAFGANTHQSRSLSFADRVDTTPTCVPPPPNMVSWWPGDGNTDDIIDGNNGILNNGATFATGMVDQAFLLDGIDDFVDVGNAPNLHVSQGDFTVDAWVNFNALRGDMSILDKMSPSGVNRDGWRLVKQGNDRFWFCFGGEPSMVATRLVRIP